MNDNIFSSFAEQAKSMYLPLNKFNTALVCNMEKLAEFQITTLKSYTEMGINQLRSAAEINDADSLRDYTAQQAEVYSSISKKIIEDAKTLTDMSLAFKQQVEEIIEESRNNATAAPVSSPSSNGQSRSKAKAA